MQKGYDFLLFAIILHGFDNQIRFDAMGSFFKVKT